MSKTTWPLNTNQHTFLDRLKICSFFLNPKNFWSYGPKVKELEIAMADYVRCRYAVFVSSGSTANTILASYLKDATNTLKKNTVVFPSTTWATSINPFLREGFNPFFIDVSMDNFGMDLDILEKYLETDDNHKEVAAVFITSLLGFGPNIQRLKEISNRFDVKIMLDNCEATLSSNYQNIGSNISNFFTSTTSTFVGHYLSSVEGGFVFTNDYDEYIYFLMARNHGMVRALINTSFPLKTIDMEGHTTLDEKYNPLVDGRFDFNIIGNNYRNSDVHALIGLLDLKRVTQYEQKRQHLYQIFKNHLNPEAFYLPPDYFERKNIPFCLPIIAKRKEPHLHKSAQNICDKLGIERRPIIGGALYLHTAYKPYFEHLSLTDCKNVYKNSTHLHDYGFYVGLHSSVKEKQILELTKELNRL